MLEDLAGRAPTLGSAAGSASSSAAAAPAAPPAAPAMAMRPRRPRKVADGSGEPAPRGKQQHSRSGAGESRGGGGEESDGEGGAPEAGEPAEKKARFVWTPEMHLRFERAVHKLGVPHAKPQAIRQLMGCEGEEYAPTRQNIKSHLQKYRQSRQNASHAADGPSALDGAPAPHAQQQQLNLLKQLELQSKLHEELLRQRQDQAELAVHLSGSGREAMRPEQLTRLAQHVMLQRQLLHHLFALLQAHTEDVMREGSQLAASLSAGGAGLPPVPRLDAHPPAGSDGAADPAWGGAFLGLAASGLGASQAGALQGLCSPLGQSQPIDVPEVSSQLEVFGGFDGMDSSVG